MIQHTEKATRACTYRGINFLDVARVEGEPGRAPTLYFHDESREPVTLSHYPGEATYQRARDELFHAERWRKLYIR